MATLVCIAKQNPLSRSFALSFDLGSGFLAYSWVLNFIHSNKFLYGINQIFPPPPLSIFFSCLPSNACVKSSQVQTALAYSPFSQCLASSFRCKRFDRCCSIGVRRGVLNIEAFARARAHTHTSDFVGLFRQGNSWKCQHSNGLWMASAAFAAAPCVAEMLELKFGDDVAERQWKWKDNNILFISDCVVCLLARATYWLRAYDIAWASMIFYVPRHVQKFKMAVASSATSI